MCGYVVYYLVLSPLPQETVFQCLQSWVRHVDVPGDELARNPLLPAAFDALKKLELFETAVDLLVEVRKRRVSKNYPLLCIGNLGVFRWDHHIWKWCLFLRCDVHLFLWCGWKFNGKSSTFLFIQSFRRRTEILQL